MFDKNTKDILDNYYYNNFDIVFLNNKDIDVDKTTLFTTKQLKENTSLQTLKIQNIHIYCNKTKNSWNNLGIKDKGEENCMSDNNSATFIPNTPMGGQLQSHIVLDNNIHQWLFSKSMGPLKIFGTILKLFKKILNNSIKKNGRR